MNDENDVYTVLQQALDELARVRADLDAKEAALRDLKLELMPFEKAVKDAKEAERAAYERARAAALAVKDAHGDLNPDDDVVIAVVREAEYNADTLLKWALERGRFDLLRIEVQHNEVVRALKNGDNLDGLASMTETFQPRIASKLGHRVIAPKGEQGS